MPTILDKVIYTAHAHTTGGRDGQSTSDDGKLSVKLAPPPALSGNGRASVSALRLHGIAKLFAIS